MGFSKLPLYLSHTCCAHSVFPIPEYLVHNGGCQQSIFETKIQNQKSLQGSNFHHGEIVEGDSLSVNTWSLIQMKGERLKHQLCSLWWIFHPFQLT